MEKFFQKMDSLPIVRMLQVAACITLAIALWHLVEVWGQAFRGAYAPNANSISNSFQLTLMTLGNIIYTPLILLALAEIIKLMKAKK